MERREVVTSRMEHVNDMAVGWRPRGANRRVYRNTRPLIAQKRQMIDGAQKD